VCNVKYRRRIDLIASILGSAARKDGAQLLSIVTETPVIYDSNPITLNLLFPA